MALKTSAMWGVPGAMIIKAEEHYFSFNFQGHDRARDMANYIFTIMELEENEHHLTEYF